MIIRKMDYPDFLATTPCRIVVFSNEIDEDSAKFVKAFDWQGNCIFSEKNKQIIKENSAHVDVVGTAIIKGDIAEDLASLAGGKVTIYPKTKKQIELTIHSSKRPRNPDGSIHHTSLELI